MLTFFMLIVQSVIIRLRTGILAGIQKTLFSAFHTWKLEVSNFVQYREETLDSCFQKVRELIVLNRSYFILVNYSFMLLLTTVEGDGS